MDRNKATLSPSKRLKTGATILAAARVVDPKPVKKSFDAFAAAHRSYCNAQEKVDEAEAELRAGQARVAQLDSEQDRAVEALALSLANNGQSRHKPFAAFNAEAPARIQAMALADEAAAIRALVANLRLDKSLSPATLKAAQRAEQAAEKVEAARVPLDALRNNLSAARERRDKLAVAWDASLGVLRRGALAAGDNGAAGLYTSLFGRRSGGRKTKPAPAQATPTKPDTSAAVPVA